MGLREYENGLGNELVLRSYTFKIQKIDVLKTLFFFWQNNWLEGQRKPQYFIFKKEYLHKTTQNNASLKGT